ncbi:hypothetical protein R1sor_002323 [Riccia sorocarpa]|uniref:Cadherin domain-containing protein n=1 Tax=Riccia sorocarpa TaxID=122646 RepID=A0ABD3H0K3_9MARC
MPVWARSPIMACTVSQLNPSQLVLPVDFKVANSSRSYILRATFPGRNLSTTAKDENGKPILLDAYSTRFYFTVDSTYVATIDLQEDSHQIVELIISALDDHVVVCLVPLEDRSSMPTISALDGFVSIDCGGTGGVDPETGLDWTADWEWLEAGAELDREGVTINATLDLDSIAAAPLPVTNRQQLRTALLFFPRRSNRVPSRRKKLKLKSEDTKETLEMEEVSDEILETESEDTASSSSEEERDVTPTHDQNQNQSSDGELESWDPIVILEVNLSSNYQTSSKEEAEIPPRFGPILSALEDVGEIDRA